MEQILIVVEPQYHAVEPVRFADQIPASDFGGWYTFPGPASLKVPAV